MTSLDRNTERMALLRGWLESRVAPEQRVWLDDQVARIANSNDGAALAFAIGLAPRKLGKTDLALTPDEIAAAKVYRPGLDPAG